MGVGVHVDLDGAWDVARLPEGVSTVDARALGPHLRYIAPEAQLKRAMTVLREGLRDERFVLYGSGDFHHLAGWWLQHAVYRQDGPNAVMLVSFDNHPDWDTRLPKWGCGGWLNRALEMPFQPHVSVWGCGNFEFDWPARIWRNHAAIRSGSLAVHPWKERLRTGPAKMFDSITRDNWRGRFEAFARSVKDRDVYVTVDMDSLAAEHAVTNWENGLFTPHDIAWGIGELRRAGARIIGGDCCGAWSEPVYARRFQRFAGNWDHPKLPPRNLHQAQTVNHRSLDVIWPAFVGE